jgi:hypothetical protein
MKKRTMKELLAITPNEPPFETECENCGALLEVIDRLQEKISRSHNCEDYHRRKAENQAKIIAELQKIINNLRNDPGTRLRRIAAKECSCYGEDSCCIVCQAEEMLGTLDTAIQTAAYFIERIDE